MLIKRIKAACIACVLVCILPVSSIALDKEEFLKFLIKSSYPESTNNNNKNSTVDETEAENKTKVENENKDYIKVHIGEKNIPNANKGEDVESGTSSQNALYKNSTRVTKENPKILIYHTHSCETYSNSPEGNYHSQDEKNSVMAVGKELTEELTNKGWGVVHTTKYHDYPSYNNSYASSLETIKQIMPQYPSIDIAIDLHREGRDLTDEKIKRQEEAKFTTTINGEKVAKFFFVVGQKNPNVGEVRQLAEEITSFAKQKYPDLVLPVIEKPYGKFNQYVAKDHMLIEIGSNATTIEESKASAKYVASVLDEYFRQNR